MIPEAFLTGVRDANYHKGGIRCLQIFQTDPEFFELLHENVVRLCHTETGSRVGEPGHVTYWTGPRGEVLQYSLLNRSGQYDDCRSDHDLSCFGKRFRGAAEYPALGRLVELFPHAINFRINVMGGRARLSPHEEHSVILTRSGSAALRIRLHLPVITNPKAEIVLDGVVYHLDAGILYLVNHGCVHSAHNDGDDRRIHLAWDVLLTREAFAFLFESPAVTGIFRRFAEAEQVAPPLRTVPMSGYARIAHQVTPEQANEVGWCDAQ